MTPLDYGVVILYLMLVAAVGFLVRGRIKSVSDYFAGGHRVPWWLAAISHHVSGYSAFAFVGYASVAYKVGLNVWTLFAVPCFFAMSVGAFVWAPRWARLRVTTAIEYLERRFNRSVHQAIAWSGIAVKFVDEGMKLYSLGVIVAACSGLPLNATIIGCGIVAMLYLLAGGLWAELITDLVQFVVQFITTIALSLVVLRVLGGVGDLWAAMPAASRHLFSEEYDLPYILVFAVVIMLSYNGGTWGLAQRFYSVGAARDARRAALLSATLYLVYPAILYIPVWAAPALIGEVEKPEETYALMAVKYLPTIAPGLIGLFVASMFAATMSMVDSDLNALAAVFTKDIYQRGFRPQASEKTLLKVGLLATGLLAVVTIVAGLVTPKLGGAFKAMMDWYAAVLGPVSVPLLFGMLNRRTTWRGALAAWGGGFATFLLVKYGLHASWTLYTGA
ncbi:MAG: sodium:solute symporter family transporter, partial [Candidatus Zipacnadales bacterium]